MRSNLTIISLIVASCVGCDIAPTESVDVCDSGAWRVCVTDELTWGRRFCGDEGWGQVCRHRECKPDAELDCLTSCGTTGTRICEADGFWGVCNHKVCDGVDNDCDGETDEWLWKYCRCGCGDGASLCIEGTWTPCEGDGPGSCTLPLGGCGDGIFVRSGRMESGIGANGRPLARSGKPPR